MAPPPLYPPPCQTPELKWSCKSEAAKILTAGIANGDIDVNGQPKQIWQSHPEFMKCKLSSFRAYFNRERARVGAHVKNR